MRNCKKARQDVIKKPLGGSMGLFSEFDFRRHTTWKWQLKFSNSLTFECYMTIVPLCRSRYFVSSRPLYSSLTAILKSVVKDYFRRLRSIVRQANTKWNMKNTQTLDDSFFLSPPPWSRISRREASLSSAILIALFSRKKKIANQWDLRVDFSLVLFWFFCWAPFQSCWEIKIKSPKPQQQHKLQ